MRTEIQIGEYEIQERKDGSGKYSVLYYMDGDKSMKLVIDPIQTKEEMIGMLKCELDDRS